MRQCDGNGEHGGPFDVEVRGIDPSITLSFHFQPALYVYGEGGHFPFIKAMFPWTILRIHLRPSSEPTADTFSDVRIGLIHARQHEWLCQG